jgi:hypothetical protein
LLCPIKVVVAGSVNSRRIKDANDKPTNILNDEKKKYSAPNFLWFVV